MFHDPVEECFFKADVVTGFFTPEPFMAEDFLALGEELLVEQRFFDEVSVFVGRMAHICFGGLFLKNRAHVNHLSWLMFCQCP
jgi:hypothetical protein